MHNTVFINLHFDPYELSANIRKHLSQGHDQPLFAFRRFLSSSFFLRRYFKYPHRFTQCFPSSLNSLPVRLQDTSTSISNRMQTACRTVQRLGGLGPVSRCLLRGLGNVGVLCRKGVSILRSVPFSCIFWEHKIYKILLVICFVGKWGVSSNDFVVWGAGCVCGSGIFLFLFGWSWVAARNAI